MPKVRLDNLEAEMKRKKITRHDIATLLGLSYRTIHSRFNGESEWGYSECVKVRDTFSQIWSCHIYLQQTHKTMVRSKKQNTDVRRSEEE